MDEYIYKLDIAFVVENTRDLLPAADKIRELIVKTSDSLKHQWYYRYPASSHCMRRARLISFSDYAYAGANAIKSTGFFDLETQRDEFLSAVDALPFTRNNRGEPQNGLEAFYTAITSDWAKFKSYAYPREFGRNAIVVISNSMPLHLHERVSCPGYPADVMPKTLPELEQIWSENDREFALIDRTKKRGIFIVPSTNADDAGRTWAEGISWSLCAGLCFDLKNLDEEGCQEYAYEAAEEIAFED